MDPRFIYHKQQLNGSSFNQLMLLAHDKLLLCLSQAIKAIEEGDIQGRFNHNKRAMEIIGVLALYLPTKEEDTLGKSIVSLYQYILSRLTEIDFKDDLNAAREVMGLLEPHRRAWGELAAREKASPLR